MATPPAPLNFRVDAMGDDVPEWAQRMCEQLNMFAAQVNESLAGGITRGDNLAAGEKLALTFTTATPASSTPELSVKHGLAADPKHVSMSKLERVDQAAITAAHSMTWRNSSGGQVLLSFQGLSGAVKYRVNLTLE